jgi:heterodisulfide reductase subunit A
MFRIGAYICHCGLNIGGVVDVQAVSEYVASLPGVVVARDYKYLCSDPGQELIRADIRDLGVNRVVVASCSPRMHEGGGGVKPLPAGHGEHPRAVFLGPPR